MEAIREVLFNSPVKNKLSSSIQSPQSGQNTIVAKSTSKDMRTNNVIKKSMAILGPKFIESSSEIHPALKPASDFDKLSSESHPVLKPALGFDKPSSDIHPGLRPAPIFDKPSSEIHPGLKPAISFGESVPNFGEPSQNLVKVVSFPPSANPTIAGGNGVAFSGSSTTSLTATNIFSKSSLTLANANCEDVKTKLIQVAVPALYSLKELALKKKEIKEKSQNFEAPEEPFRFKPETKMKVYTNSKNKVNIPPDHKYQEKNGSSINPQLSIPLRSKMEPNGKRKSVEKTTITLEDDDSDIEVEEINILPKQTFNAMPIPVVNYVPNSVVNPVPIEPGIMSSQSDQVISVIMKQVEELETTLKMNVANKESELQIERQIVGQLKKKNQILELRDKKRKEAIEKKDFEYAKEVDKKNNEIETLRSFTNSMAQKLTQKQEEMESIRSISKKNSDFLSKKLVQKQTDLTVLEQKFDKVLTELNALQKWNGVQKIKSVQVVKERESLKNLVQGHLAKEAIYKQTIESLNIKIVEKDQLAKDLKIKVHNLIAEFTKGFKDKDDELNCKTREIDENSSEICKLKGRIVDLESKELMLEKRATIINDLSIKLNIATHDKENLHLKVAQLQSKISKLKTIQANGIIIKDEDLFEDKLDQFVYDNHGKRQADKPLMLTYLWPIFSVHVDPSLLKKRKEESKTEVIWKVNNQGKPQMITYLWPLLPFQQKVKPTVSCTSLKSKISFTCSGKRAKLSEDCFSIPFIDNISILKTIEQVNILDDGTEFNDKRTSGKNHNWPIVVHHKRKFEEFIKNEVKRIKLDTELKVCHEYIPVKSTIQSIQTDDSKEIAASILDDVVKFAGRPAINFVSDILAEVVEKAENMIIKNWPVIFRSPKVPLKGTFKVNLKGRSKADIYIKAFSLLDILQINPSFLHFPPFRGTDPITDKLQCRNYLKIKYNWPVMIYKRNVLNLKNLTDDKSNPNTDDKIISEEPIMSNENLNCLEVTLKEAISDCKKRKPEDDLKITISKKVKLYDHKGTSDKVIDELLENVVHGHEQNAIKLIDDILDYVIC